jgi:hypothetical protein
VEASETQAATASTSVAPPYFAFKTLTNMLVKMEEHGPPNRVDRSFLGGMSNAGQTQFIAGLKSLGLIADDQSSLAPLSALVTNPDERPALIGELVRRRYPEAVELGKTNATTDELVKIFKDHYGVQGDTARKAIAFFLQAAQYAGDIRLSPHFKTPSNRGNGSSAGSRRRARGSGGDAPDIDPPPPSPTEGLHPAIVTLVGALPGFSDDGSKPEFASVDRSAWFAYAKATFNLIYALPEGDSGEVEV